MDVLLKLAAMIFISVWAAGMNKMVINHLERLFVTSDASTIVTELEVNHPAAKLLVEAAKAQEAEMGDGTNLVGHRSGTRNALLPSTCCPHLRS
jgi:T-complex protein 1 subunit theta